MTSFGFNSSFSVGGSSFNYSTPSFNTGVGSLDFSTPSFDTGVGSLDFSTPSFDTGADSFDFSTPSFDTGTSGFDTGYGLDSGWDPVCDDILGVDTFDYQNFDFSSPTFDDNYGMESSSSGSSWAWSIENTIQSGTEYLSDKLDYGINALVDYTGDTLSSWDDSLYTAYTTPLYHYPDAKMIGGFYNVGSGISGTIGSELLMNTESGEFDAYYYYGAAAGITSWSLGAKFGEIFQLPVNRNYLDHFAGLGVSGPLFGADVFGTTHGWLPEEFGLDGICNWVDPSMPYGYDVSISTGALPVGLSVNSTFYKHFDPIHLENAAYFMDPKGAFFNAFDDMSIRDYVHWILD